MFPELDNVSTTPQFCQPFDSFSGGSLRVDPERRLTPPNGSMVKGGAIHAGDYASKYRPNAIFSLLPDMVLILDGT